MTEPPGYEITRGQPSPDEEAAVRAAVLRLWQEDQRAAAASVGVNGWTASGRAAISGRAVLGRGADAWHLSGRIGAEPVGTTQTGRGDAK